jgi:hypothetical protein
MAYKLHDTAHAEKRARDRGFTIEQATLTINEPGSILKTPRRKGNHLASSGYSFARLKVESSLSSPK